MEAPCRMDTMLILGIFCGFLRLASSVEVWFMTTKILILFGVLFQTASLFMLLIYAFLPNCFRNRNLMATTIGLNFSAGVLTVVGLCIFGFKVIESIQDSPESEWFLSYSFSLACTAFVLSSVSGSILMTENKRLSSRATSKDLKERDNIALPVYKLKS